MYSVCIHAMTHSTECSTWNTLWRREHILFRSKCEWFLPNWYDLLIYYMYVCYIILNKENITSACLLKYKMALCQHPEADDTFIPIYQRLGKETFHVNFTHIYIVHPYLLAIFHLNDWKKKYLKSYLHVWPFDTIMKTNTFINYLNASYKQYIYTLNRK